MDQNYKPGTDDTQSRLEEEEAAYCLPQYGYRLSIWRSLILYPLATLPVGIGLLLAYWFPHVWVRLTCSSSSLKNAHFVIVKDLDSKWKVEKVQQFYLGIDSNDSNDDTSHLISDQTVAVKYFIHRHLRYLYDKEKAKYVLLRGYERNTSCTDLHAMQSGLHSNEQGCRLAQYGANSIDVPVKSYHVLLIEEVLHPFYIFQILSIIFWMIDDYYLYSGAVLVIFIISMLVSLIQTRRHMQQLHDMVSTSNLVNVLRNGQVYKNVSSLTLVPGDVLVIPREGMVMTCDAVLLTGNAIVNESMLTGESVPITKTPLPMEDKPYTPETYKRHTLFAGTEIVQARYYTQGLVLAVVIRTGFLTTKGGLVRSILFPKPLNIKFYWDSIKFILLLSILAGCGFIYTILVLQLHKPPYEVKETILRAFDIITTIVPPSLPAAITVGTVYALNRLKKQQIYCISPQRVNLCGKVKLVCFDKTGTLTEDSLDLLGVQPATSKGFSYFVQNVNQLSQGPLLYAMTTCHSLTRINGELTGDPLDLKMFQATGWILEEPGDDTSRYDTLQLTVVRPPDLNSEPSTPNQPLRRCPSPWEPPMPLEQDTPTIADIDDNNVQLGILKQFTFSSELQRMSVLVRKLPEEHSRQMFLFVKGAPEMIKKLSLPETVPSDFYEVLSSLTQRGYRVLGVAYRDLRMAWHRAERLKREEIECDLTFCGLIALENKLKPETVPTLQELQLAAIRTVMVTGDNLLTAIAISRTSGMVAFHHHIIIIKATPTSNGSLPNLSYHLFDNDDIDHSALCSSTTDDIPIKVITNGTTINGGYNSIQSENMTEMLTHMSNGYQALNIESQEYFHLAVDGLTFGIIRQYYPQIFERLVVCGTVFARMSPVQKGQLVSALMDVGYGVAMCGDGANDCGALKTAHVGISLSESEASVASPFTSKTPNISCVPLAIKEGRAALVTSFSVFKFMALYSLTEFTTAAILYAIESNMGNFEYLYIDLVLILAFAFVMGLTGPYPYLVKRRPLGTLAGVHVFLSILTQTAIMLAGQLGIFFYLSKQHWFTPLQPSRNSENIVCWENTAVFTVSIFQYIALAVAFSTAAPYRKPLYTNLWFMGCLAVLIPANLYITLAPSNWWPWFWQFSQLKPSPSLLFRVTVVELGAVNFILAYFLEGYIFPSSLTYKILRIIRCKRQPRNRYKHVLRLVKEDIQWPPPLPLAISAHC